MPTDHPPVYEWIAIFSEVANFLGIEHTITSVVRTREQQMAIWHDRRGTNRPAAKPGQSTHEYGLAFDVAARNPKEQTELGLLGEALGMHWGGRFRQADPWHLQLVSPSAWAKIFTRRP